MPTMYHKFYFCCLAVLSLLITPVRAVEVVFRYDDLMLTPSETDKRVVAFFGERNIPLSIAVIPCDSNEVPIPTTDSALLAALRGGGYEVALHGLTHQATLHNGEFGALSKEETFRRIHKGKTILQEVTGKRINTFIPPFNAINPYVAEAMLQDSMHILSADMFSHAVGSIDFFPETLGHFMEQRGVWQAAKTMILNCKEKDAICVIMFHSYDLQTDTAWKQLDNLLAYCQSTPSVHLYTFTSLAESGVHSSRLRYRVNQWESGLQKYLLQHGVLHSTQRCVVTHCLNALLYALLVVPFWGVCVVCGRRKTNRTNAKRERLFMAIPFCVSALCVFFLAWFHLLGPLKLLALTLCINSILCVGISVYQRQTCCAC